MLLDFLALGSGSIVGLMLGLIGGGGSILAVPLLLYVVGVRDAHIAIGTSAVAVSANAFANLATHWRAGNVKWPCAATFAASGLIGAYFGAELGQLVSGSRLLLLFSAVMFVIAAAMLKRKATAGDPGVRLNAKIASRLVPTGAGTGLLAGFFGIGGGFLIVPGIMFASGMPMLNAVGSSLFAVGIFGIATAASYAHSGLVDWRLAAELLVGGIAGGIAGQALATRLSADPRILTRIFSGVLILVAIYMAARTSGYVT